jgi:phospholipid/cholesterol/gamma-HCH transport system permease protein
LAETNVLAWIGSKTRRFLGEFGAISRLLYRTVSYTGATFKNRGLLVKQMYFIGTGSLPLVLMIGFFTGMVSALQAAYLFKGLIPNSFVGSAVSRAIFVELGPVLTAIVVAGRVGASMAAEIGTMKVTEQIDALESLGINPIRFLSSPRFLASIIMLPILVIFADGIALIGSYVVSNYFLGLSSRIFFDSVKRLFDVKDVLLGLLKAFVFGGTTALLGVYVGFETDGGAEGVGKATVRAFVLSSAMVLVMDFLIWTVIS